ncbi:spore coat protein U domain-containing protein [Sphingomonas sp. A2-49]|uniref:spore coat protein U domain-containing protein n=1 Tax=Sphingomonas sp. A2-49 TaxID=1391375 RepID=UPI0021D0C7BB|nr:spore coat protein U domain-containing protein [Sphingomonas sp. A2-49]MCU6452599.1 spore coat protein U domain-containing protein [Sphingomonas sp. A2-49]
MTRLHWVQRLAMAVLLATALPGVAAACTVTSKVTAAAGPYSSAAVAAAKVPAIATQAGFTCAASILNLFGGNYLKATFTSLNGLTLKNGSRTLPYTAFADSGSTVQWTQGKQVDYAQNNLLNVLGLLGGSGATLPLYVKPGSATGLTDGDYVDKITIAWDWQMCSVAFVLGNCAGTLDKGTGTSEITVTVTVARQDMTIALTSVTTWDPVNGAGRPLALPGSKGRTSLVVRNPDLVSLDDGSIALVYQVPAKTSVALDGDGTGSATIVGYTDGSPTSGTTMTYTAGSSTDDVDFSADNAASWTYAPVAGNRTSEAAVTHIRFRPRGAMRPGSSFTLSFPYLVR